MKRFITWGTLCLLMAGSAGAEQAAAPVTLEQKRTGTAPPSELTLEQALTLLDERSPWTAAERARVDVAAADRVEANILPNPSFSYGTQLLAAGVNTGSSVVHELSLEQPLLIFGQRGVRRELAERNVSAEQARVKASVAERAFAVREAFAALLTNQEELRVLQETSVDLGRVEKVVKGRASAGDSSRYDVERIEVESRALEVEVMNARASVDDASGRLAALLGIEGWHPRAQGTLRTTESLPDLPLLWESAQQRRPSLVAARARQEVARGGLDVARRDRLPVPSVAAGVMLTRNEKSTIAMVGVGLPLPLFDRNQGSIARASAEMQAEARALDAELAEARAELSRAHAVLEGRKSALVRLEQDVVERLPTMRRMAEDAYREGRGGILELLDAFRSLKDMRVLHLKQMETVKVAEASVLFAAGMDAAP
ncbi:Heavy metal RND efflux outer membrane protein, CzcC family [Myxococcus hansupus]|uniref:Heavy metal RND efflux outer membrane protein, CzcC family n=1 Tax=Pseudomyxococcus hansupus TaxID=1297742 RepID=A0A0H4X9E2_9BACT|nr:TolC family protein [Myxococcus hansupus]AKQ70185.1 Heavy metal RND efflux outer membrane protein, CzcC family [Myxococcus hansupus]